MALACAFEGTVGFIVVVVFPIGVGCEEKIKSMYINKYDDLDDLLDYDDFCIELAEKHGIYLGDVSEINEFM